jgi:hypothetical protein
VRDRGFGGVFRRNEKGRWDEKQWERLSRRLGKHMCWEKSPESSYHIEEEVATVSQT